MSYINIVILCFYFLLVCGVGWRFCRMSSLPEQHYLAGRSMGAFPIGISIMVTSFSAVNFIAIPDEVSHFGLYVILSFPVFFLAAWPISKIWMPFFNHLRVTTVYEFLEKRFSRRVRLLASGIFLGWRMLWMAVALYVSGKILSMFIGGSAIHMAIVCGCFATLYTCLGGMKAVMWTDVLQFVILMAGIALGVIFAARMAPDGIFETAWAGGRLRPYCPMDWSFFSFDPQKRMTFWSVIIGTFVAFMTRYGADQVVMQRYFSARNLKQAQRGIWLNAAVSCVALGLLTILGLSLYASASCEGIAVARGFALKQLVAMSRHFPPGCAGILVAGILAATMSSVDSGINACAASLTTDFRLKARAPVLTLMCGVVVTALAVILIPPLNQHQGIFAIVNRFVNGLGTPLLCIVMAGMFSRRLQEKELFYGGIIGIAASMWLTATIAHLALHYYAVVNGLATALACYICFLIRKLKS